MSTRVPPPVYAFAAGLAQWLLSGRRPATGPSTLAALPVLAASAALGLSAVRGFVRVGTTVDPHAVERASTLVVVGPNRFTRNPMYVAMAGGLLAHAIARRSWVALLPIAGFVAVLDRTQIPAEEAALGVRFGADYDDYLRRVPRWGGARAGLIAACGPGASGQNVVLMARVQRG